MGNLCGKSPRNHEKPANFGTTEATPGDQTGAASAQSLPQVGDLLDHDDLGYEHQGQQAEMTHNQTILIHNPMIIVDGFDGSKLSDFPTA